MTKNQFGDQKGRDFFEKLWKQGDPWQFQSSSFEQDKYTRQLALLEGRRYARVLEIGCGAGTFTRLLSRIADLSSHQTSPRVQLRMRKP
jgi:SAM-dependent methyltransferase